MSIIAENSLKQSATYWAPGIPNGEGGVVYDAPTVINCRWEDREDEIKEGVGESFVSKARVFVEDTLEMQGYLFLGTSIVTDPTTVDGAELIQKREDTPNLWGEIVEKIVYL